MTKKKSGKSFYFLPSKRRRKEGKGGKEMDIERGGKRENCTIKKNFSLKMAGREKNNG